MPPREPAPFNFDHLFELWDVRALLDHGDKLLLEYSLAERHAPPIMAVLALGTERLGKLTYGFATGDWRATRTWSHRLAELDIECRRIVRDAAPTEFIRDLADAVDSDKYISRFLQLLQVYASDGRFHHLDRVGGVDREEESPGQLWRGLTGRVLSDRQDLYVGYDWRDTKQGEAIQHELNEELRRSLYRWRSLYYYAWLNGACGPIAKRLGSEMDPARDRPRPSGMSDRPWRS